MHRQHICISLHEEALVLVDDAAFGLEQPVKLVAFLIDYRLRGIDVLCPVVFFQRPASEGYHFSCDVKHGKHHAPFEAVVIAALVVHAQPGLHRIFRIESVLLDGIVEGGAVVHRIAEMEFLDYVVVESAFVEIA